MNTVDARGLSCPMPVVMVQNEVKKNSPAEFQVLLDSECSVENVTRFAKNNGYEVKAEEYGDDTTLTCTKK